MSVLYREEEHFNLPSANDSKCYGYGIECVNERDEDKELCDECQEAADVDERERFAAEMEAEGIKPIVFYEHLTDGE